MSARASSARMPWPLGPLAPLLVLAACAGATPAPQNASDADDAAYGSVHERLAAPPLTPQAAALASAQQSVARARQDELANPAITQGSACDPWPLWQRYAEHFISAEGRVIDRTANDRTTSEGQAYGLFFALVNNDRARFDKLLQWTEKNLAGSSLRAHLPAWLWGKQASGDWGTVDPNAASDADVWIAYTLLEAARAFKTPAYAELGRALATRIAREEVVDLQGLGPTLLPGPKGFVDAHVKGAGRLNASYLVLPVLRRLASLDGDDKGNDKAKRPWAQVVESSRRVLLDGAPRGLSPDWQRYVPGEGFVDDIENKSICSYDAIRVYLWSAMLPEDEPQREQLARAAQSFSALVARLGRVPERIDVRTAEVSMQDGPPGFTAVALLSARAAGDSKLASELEARLDRTLGESGLYGNPPAYYDQNLSLFALGFLEGRYRFHTDGSLQLPWEQAPCGT
jgi:endo-1,4-beta-D-glucanase Y